MDFITNNSRLMMEQSMRFLWTKQTAILDNISNVETPNYKTKYVTFEETLQRNLQAAAGDARPKSSMRDVLSSSRAVVHEADNESTRMDDNGVNLTEQGVELARNAYQLQYAMNAINSDFSRLRAAIKGQ